MHTPSNHHSIKDTRDLFPAARKGISLYHPPTHPSPSSHEASPLADANKQMPLSIINASHKPNTFKSPHILHIKDPSIREEKNEEEGRISQPGKKEI
jgi:hypothetical protein